MPIRIRLTRLNLAYRDGMVLHTATSGAVPALDEVRLVVERDGAVAALGASRVNIAYLSGIDADTLAGMCVRAVMRADWTRDWTGITAGLDAVWPDLAPPARMLVEMAAADGAARTRGEPLARFLGGDAAARVPTNQTLFHADDVTTMRRAEAYVARGFTDLKLRIGLGDIENDIRRLRLLRERFGDTVMLSVDANGCWDADAARGNLAKLSPFGLRYVEQPIAAKSWGDLVGLTAVAPVPLMLDESIDSAANIERLAACGRPFLAHLKLAKLGGLDRLMRAGRLLRDAGIGVMVGQMNEGSVSTLAAAHAAAALRAPYCELYGADDLVGDPAGALTYEDGHLTLPPGAGLGLRAHEATGTILWEQTL